MKLFLSILAYIFFFNVSVFGQESIKPAYQQIKLVEYELSGTGASPKIKITDVQDINGATMHRLTKTYRGICDTTYQLDAKNISTLNMLFNGSKPLKSYLKTTHMEAGKHYGGYPPCLFYTDVKGNIQQLMVAEPLMTDDFMKVFDAMTRFPFPVTVKYKGDRIIDAKLEAEVLKAYKAAGNYVPKTEAPPTMDGPPPMGN